MISFENTQVVGLEAAVRGMRNPMNSWEKSDSQVIKKFNGFILGPNDHDLMLRLAKAGSVEGKFRRMIVVYVDITAPLYWWKEFDTYKIGTVANSCSTMHKIHEKEFTMDDFSHEHFINKWDFEAVVKFKVKSSLISDIVIDLDPDDIFQLNIKMLNRCRKLYNETKDKQYWWQMIQLLPSSYNQRRTVMLNYEVLSNIYQNRRNHKLDEWKELCKWIEGLPNSDIITCNAEFVEKAMFNTEVDRAIQAVAKMNAEISRNVYAIEECSELIQELAKQLRGKDCEKDILEEACDVLTTILVLLESRGASKEFICEQILYKCKRALERYEKTGEV